MPQCKKANCREEAVPGGKRYCPAHMREYKQKQAEYRAIEATLRCCVSCGQKLTKTAHDRGDLTCRDCTATILATAARRSAQAALEDELMACGGVDDLKTFILKHLLPERT